VTRPHGSRGSRAALCLALTVVFSSGCQPQDTAGPPPAVEPTRDAITYYGRMILVDHRGPPRSPSLLKF